MEMKAFLLIAGKGTRLKPLTDHMPKCLLSINGMPLLGIWLTLFKKYGVTEILVNLHHLSRMVEDYLKNNNFGVRVTTFYEPSLLGSAGTVLANKDFVKKEEAFFIIYGDNLTNIDLVEMAKFHKDQNTMFTMGLFRTQRPEQAGIAEIDDDNSITSFVEKPSNPISNLANAGIYIANKELFNYIPRKEFVDFGFDVLPGLVGKMSGYIIEEYLTDIGNHDSYCLANQVWKGI